jgi:hypothetical protein
VKLLESIHCSNDREILTGNSASEVEKVEVAQDIGGNEATGLSLAGLVAANLSSAVVLVAADVVVSALGDIANVAAVVDLSSVALITGNGSGDDSHGKSGGGNEDGGELHFD